MFDSADARETFGRIYATDEWAGGSGDGSRADATEAYRTILETVIQGSDVGSVVDVGCGDWEFSQLVSWSGVSYLGLDVVPDVIAANQARFGGDHVRFDVLDAVNGRIPRADLLVCKDVLQHWPNAAIHRFIDQNRRRYRYLLVTNDVASVHSPPELRNTDIPLGAWRTLDLEREPFGLRPAWTADLDIRGEWTKRVLALVRPRSRLRARIRPGTALERLQTFPRSAVGARPNRTDGPRTGDR